MNCRLSFPPQPATLVVSLRLLCRRLEKPVRGYLTLKALTPPLKKEYDKKNPETFEWHYTPEGVDGWSYLEERNLPKAVLHSLWEDEALEIQQLDANGAWHDTFNL